MIAKCAGIGPGGLTPSPATRSASGEMTAATTMVSTSSASPLAGWPILARNGGLAPHSTTAITCIGIRHSVKNVTSPANDGKSKSEMKPSEIAIVDERRGDAKCGLCHTSLRCERLTQPEPPREMARSRRGGGDLAPEHAPSRLFRRSLVVERKPLVLMAIDACHQCWALTTNDPRQTS